MSKRDLTSDFKKKLKLNKYFCSMLWLISFALRFQGKAVEICTNKFNMAMLAR